MDKSAFPHTPLDQLDAWLEPERLVKAVVESGVGCGIATPEHVAGKTALAILQAMMRGELPCSPRARTSDCTVLEVAAGSATFQGTPRLQHNNPLGTVHGGRFETQLESDRPART